MRFTNSVALVFSCVAASLPATPSTGDASRLDSGEFRTGIQLHDPSTIVKCKDEYWVFSTGRGILSHRSKDLREWSRGPSVFRDPPAWAEREVPGNKFYYWAPDVICVSNRYLLYYSVSTWGSRQSAIGLATARTLDPGDPACGWRDEGIVIRSRGGDDFNAIDPSVVADGKGGLWMAFGSFWSGIKLVELDPATGLRRAPDSTLHSVAWKNEIEAPCLIRRGGMYYLFINWGLCCKGVDSTYNIRVGRSAAITGPYVDSRGRDLLRGGGDDVLGTRGDMIGPGHAGFVGTPRGDYMSFHFYNGSNRGRSELALRPVEWSDDGWPRMGKTSDTPLPSRLDGAASRP